MFVFVLLAAVVLSNILANFFKVLSVASPNYKYRVIDFGCSFKDVMRSFAAWKKIGQRSSLLVFQFWKIEDVLCPILVCLLFL